MSSISRSRPLRHHRKRGAGPMTYRRQYIYAALASLAVLGMLGAIVIGAALAYRPALPDVSGANAHGAVTVHSTTTGTVVRDPWCIQSEDSCRVNYRPSGLWVIRRVSP